MEGKNHRRTIARNSIGFLAAGLLGHAHILFTVPILTRWLPEPEWGFYTILLQLNVVLQFAALTLFSQSILKFYVEFQGRDRARFIGTAFTTVAVCQVIFVTSLYATRNSLLPALYPNLTLSLDPVLGVAAVWFLAAPLRMLGLAVLKIQERIRGVIVLNAAYGVCLLIAILYLVVLKNGSLVDAVMAMAVAESLLVLVSVIALRQDIELAFVRAYFRRAIVFASPLLAGTLCVLVLNNLDRLILSRHTDLAGMGIYGVGAMIGNTLGLVVTAAMTAVSPRMVKVLSSEGDAPAAELASAVMADVFVMVGIPFAILCLFSDSIVLVLVGDDQQWVPAATVAIGVAAGHFVRSLYMLSQNILFYKGRTIQHFATNASLLLIAFLVGAWLPTSDPFRIAWLLAITYLSFSPVTFAIARRYLRVSPNISELIAPTIGFAVCLLLGLHSTATGADVSDPQWWFIKVFGIFIMTVCCFTSIQRLYLSTKTGSEPKAGQAPN